ncbi:uroporphyrinogen-III synthase [Silvibacterium sp.]|uniref:uroporphyrinogen-III synthase n=1 Tax=Silvibacterium sp. TaxID=1964179 RepID=UPI0039E3F050
MSLPLTGRRVLVTRASVQAGRLSAKLTELGAEAIEIPAIAIEPPESFEILDAALRDLSRYQLLTLTSANAVAPLLERMQRAGVSIEALAALRVAAIGPATARALREAGVRVDVIPEEYVAESLLAALREDVAGQLVLVVRAAVARDVLPEGLRAQGAEVTVADAYRTVIPQSSIEMIRTLFAEGAPKLDAATFTSASTVTNFLALLERAGLARPAGLRAVSIGPITSEALRAAGWEPAVEAAPHDLDGLVEALVKVLA